MITGENYVKPGTLEEAYELNQKRANRIIGGMMWIRMGRGNVNTVIDLSGLGLDQITRDRNRISHRLYEYSSSARDTQWAERDIWRLF